MMTDIQREVAVHLLANALRRLRAREQQRGERSGDEGTTPIAQTRGKIDEMYLRGMLDMLRGLYGPAMTDELHRLARAFERSKSTR